MRRAGRQSPDHEHEHEGEEFDYLAPEIIRTENFDMDELQTFLALWCTGHIAGTYLR